MRAALLAQADPELRREVESLLIEPASGEFIDRPAIQNVPHLLEDSTLTELASGASLGPYRFESKLGEGGMGEVFRAIDTRLGRAVVIKTTHGVFVLEVEASGHAGRAASRIVGPCPFAEPPARSYNGLAWYYCSSEKKDAASSTSSD